ncbi:MAG: YfbR-like 5'-deoxynucleotidase [Methanoregula sp.]
MKVEVTDDFKAPFGAIPALRASIVPRWSIIKTTRPQSLAEHNYNVSMITKYLCTAMAMVPAMTQEAVMYALTHDYEEIYTGDIPSPAKIKEKREVKKVTEAVVKLADALEAWLFIQHNCADSDEVRMWVQDSLHITITNLSDSMTSLPNGTITKILSSCAI